MEPFTQARFIDLFEFMCAHEPRGPRRDRRSFRDTVAGAPAAFVASVEQARGVVLPTWYRDFVVTMGRGCRGFVPFSSAYAGRQEHDFLQLVERAPGASRPPARFFRVSTDVDDGIDHADIFLDLARSDGHDAPLVLIDPTRPFDSALVSDLGWSLAEALTRSAFLHFRLSRHRYSSIVIACGDSTEWMVELRDAAEECLLQAGMQLSLRSLARVRCLAGDDCAAMVEECADGSLALCVRIAGGNRQTLRQVGARLTDALPDADFSEAR